MNTENPVNNEIFVAQTSEGERVFLACPQEDMRIVMNQDSGLNKATLTCSDAYQGQIVDIVDFGAGMVFGAAVLTATFLIGYRTGRKPKKS